jgi:hypothetical protein
MQGLTDIPADRVTHIMKNRMYVKISSFDTVTECIWNTCMTHFRCRFPLSDSR